MMMRIDDLERRLQDLLLTLRPPGRVAVTRSGRSTAGHGGSRRTGLSVGRGRAKYSATEYTRRSDQHCATRYRTPASRLLSHRLSSDFFWFEPALTCGWSGVTLQDPNKEPAFVCCGAASIADAVDT